MTVLIIDNYDSFVYNLSRYVKELGHNSVVHLNDAITLQDIQNINPSHIILSPGPCTPDEAGITLNTIQHFYKKIPILGVCLGHQAIAQALGGKVIRAKHPMHGKSCAITHSKTGIFKDIPSPLAVGRYHSLVACPRTLPQSLRITAYDIHQEIMAFEHQNYPLFGVQFHPESILTELGHHLLNNFLNL